MWIYLEEPGQSFNNPLCALLSSYTCGSTTEFNVGSYADPATSPQLLAFGKCFYSYPRFPGKSAVPVKQWQSADAGPA